MSKSQNIIAFRQRRKMNLIKVAGGKCAICGYDHCVTALEFHHIDPAQKSYGVAVNGNCHDLEKDLAEIKKCILVCANCHREIHEGLYSEVELWDKQNYSEEIAEQLRQEKHNLQTKTHYFCSSCGVEITCDSSTGMCAPCAAKSRRVATRPSRDELKFLIRTCTFTDIGRKYGVTDNAIRKWCLAEGLPRKKTEINNYSDEEWNNI